MVRQSLAADLVDHVHIVIVPIILGHGEPVWEGVEDLEQRFDVGAVSSPSGVTHLTFTRRRHGRRSGRPPCDHQGGGAGSGPAPLSASSWFLRGLSRPALRSCSVLVLWSV
jgi:hypothetical protein